MKDSHVVTPALENYLEAVYILRNVKKPVKVMDVADFLDVKMPSVTYNMKKLAEKKLIRHIKRSHIELTPEGESIARSVYNSHRELLKFFHEILGVPEDRAEQEACRVEHIISRDTFERLSQFTRWMESVPPEYAFRPIEKDDSGQVVERSGMRLSDATVGSRVRVLKVHSSGELRKRLIEMGMSRDTEIKIERIAPLGDPIEIKLKGFHLSLRKSEARQIDVETIE